MPSVWPASDADLGAAATLLGEFRDWWGRAQPGDEDAVWTDSEECELEDLYVRREARGAGFGRALVSAAMERARARGCGRMLINANEANAPAVALYRSLGFSAWFAPPGGHNLNMRRDL